MLAASWAGLPQRKEESDDDAAVEGCIEELEELVMSLDRYPPAAVAMAIGTYLEGLLGALVN